jgi:5-methylcytosine-specific restriction protein A
VSAVPKPTPTLKEPRTLKQRVHRIPRHVRAMVLARDNMTCRWCKRRGGALDPHHILRRSQGGTDDQANLVSLHRLCHSYVHEHPLEAKARGFLA